jgi:carboxyl-terminal processing protease
MKGKSENKKWIITICLVLVFSFFSGYYFSYRVNEKGKTKLEIIQDIMENEWYYGIDDEDIESTLETKMILGMLDLTTDPFTRYLTSLGTLADSYTGIGVSISIYGEYFIIDEVSSKYALEDGIKAQDIIIAVNNVSVANKTIDELNEMVNANSSVALTIVRNNDYDNPLVINTGINSYEPLTVFTKEYDNNIAYVKISEFNLDTSSYLKTYFDNLANNYVNLVLDLRGNPGGYISAVRDVLDLFVSSNKIVMTTTDKNGNTEVIKTKNDSFYLFNKIVVLIDNNSASGAEALSAALNYHLDQSVILYGDTTYGKGSAQKTYYFSDGTYFHYTYALWNTPYGYSINHTGVEAEVSDVNEGISSLSISNKELNLYDYGSDVLNIQKLLKILGYYNGELHSFLDENTSDAISKFQSDYNLETNGVIDKATLRVISKLVYDDKINYSNDELNRVLNSMFN